MKMMNRISASLLSLASGSIMLAQTERPGRIVPVAQPGMAAAQEHGDERAAALDGRALQVSLKLGNTLIVSAADAMPADKSGFAPTDGEFKGVRTFGQQVKHLAATNHILAAAALGEPPPADAGDEAGPETVRTKAAVLDYLNGSFEHVARAIDAIGDKHATVKSSPISPLKSAETTRLALTVEAMIHAFDHYGQMVEYLRMNRIVPAASRL
jgi:hypothetical protein